MPKNSFSCAGDFCLSSDEIRNSIEATKLDPWAGIRSAIGDDTEIIVNLECPFTEQTEGFPFKWANLKASPHLHWTLDGLTLAVLGNNHITDFGVQGARDTQALLASKGIEFVGYGASVSDALRPAFLNIGDYWLGVVSLCCPTTNGENLATHLMPGVAPLGMQTLHQAITAAKPKCDALLVYLHWGCEWVHDPAPDQLRLARYAIDCGADAVIGCHSHTIQSYEQYRGRWIFYGLGNYLFHAGFGQRVLDDGRIVAVPLKFSPPNRESLVVQFSVKPDSGQGNLALQRVQPMHFGDDWLPRPITRNTLTFDLDESNARLHRYSERNAGALHKTKEPVFRTQLRNGILAYWYGEESINRPRNISVRRFLGRKFLRERPMVSLGNWLVRAASRGLRRFTGLLVKAAAHLKQRGWGEYVMGRTLIDVLFLSADIEMVLRTYRGVFGSYPRLVHPRTFNEKMQRAKLINRKIRYTQFADKIAVRDIVQERVGPDILTVLYWVGTDLLEARQAPLPLKFVIKANQSSGNNLIVQDAAQFEWESATMMTKKWLEKDHSMHFAEWQYRWISPKLLIEEYLEGADGGVPIDYKFFCFHGRVQLVQVDFDRFTNHTRALFDREFNLLPVGLMYSRYYGSAARPPCFEEMREIAECLAAGESFLRVDLYDVGKPVFGELTLHPGAGLEQFDPHDWDTRVGTWL